MISYSLLPKAGRETHTNKIPLDDHKKMSYFFPLFAASSAAFLALAAAAAAALFFSNSLAAASSYGESRLAAVMNTFWCSEYDSLCI